MNCLTRRPASLCVFLLLMTSAALLRAQTLTPSPTSVSFGNQAVLTTSTAKTVHLTNTGTATLVVSAITITPPGAPFAITKPSGTGACLAPSFSLAPNKSCTIGVTFSPVTTSTSPFTGKFSITDNAPGSPQTVGLTGLGVPQATLSTASQSFGNVGIGSSSAKTVTLTNNLSSPLVISGITAGGDFAIGLGATTLDTTTPCGPSVPKNSRCSINVVFTPTQLGPRTATLTVTNSANNSPQTAALTGNGTTSSVASISVTPANSTISAGANQTFTATGNLPGGITQNLTTLVSWNSSSTNVATISNTAPSQGVATGIAKGKTTITATLTGSKPVSTSLTVTASGLTTPTISWAPASPITYGTPLGAAQLNAAANAGGTSVPGTFVYTPAAGAVLAAGSQKLSVTFTPTDTTHYTTATVSANLTVNKATPAIAWATPAAINYGTALTSAQLNATASAAGSFVYSPAAGTTPAPGTDSLSVTFTPTDATDYNTATASVSLTVTKATPTITWPTPTAITYGTALSSAQLNATASVAGTFAYSPAAGTTPTAGTDTLSVTFTPTNTTDYNAATTTVTLTVNKATPVITWVSPTAITYGTALGSTQLDATASVSGTFVYTPAAGTTPTAGTDTLSTTFTPADATDYATATASVSLTVNQAAPTITWPVPSPITSGTALSATQLNATASVPGSFAYSPAAGTIPPTGADTLSATFTPTDAVNYSTAMATVVLTVNAAVTLTSITVTPSDSTILLGGNTRAFTATGKYSDGTTADLTGSAIWSSSAPAEATMTANTATSASSGCGGPILISAMSGSITGSTSLKVTVSGGSACMGNMTQARDPHTATLLNTGKVLIAGGYGIGGVALQTAELYDPGPATSTATGPMGSAHAYHTATQLNDGTVLIVGGVDSTGSPTTSAELFSPVANAFATVTGLNANGVTGLNTARYQHTATLLGDGTVLIVGGLDRTGSPTTSAELYNPATQTFTAVAGLQGSLSTARLAHTATLLRWGGVLIAGGYDSNGNSLASAELYDPSCTCIYLNTDNNNVVSGMSVSRAAHTATPLNDGTVLIVGGDGGSPSTAEVYNPNTGLFATSGNLSTGRYLHTSTMLTNGTILVAGGVQFNSGTATASEEIYDPTFGAFTSVGNLLTARFSQTATLLPDGTVLIAGGVDSNRISLASLELYTPATFTPTGFTGGISVNPTAPAIPLGTTVQFTASETFSSGTQPLGTVSWSSSDSTILRITNDSTNSGLAFPVALGPVTVTACAGTVCGSTLVTVAPAALVSISVAPANGFLSVPPGNPLAFTAAGLYTDGSTGPVSSLSWTSSVATVAVIDPVTGQATPATPLQYGTTTITASAPGLNGVITGSSILTVTDVATTASLATPVFEGTATILNCPAPCPRDGQVLIVGGSSAQAQVYDPVFQTFSFTTGSMAYPRDYHTATVLDNGDVLIAGGTAFVNAQAIQTAEVYDPRTDTFTTVGSMSVPRILHTATLIHCTCLDNGKVLIAGGDSGGNILQTAELFDPASGTFSPVGTMISPREHFTATLLNSTTGQVLLAGGYAVFSSGSTTNTAEIYDPTARTFSQTLGNLTLGNLASFPGVSCTPLGREGHTATLLNTGQVLIEGGVGQSNCGSGGLPTYEELFDPASGQFNPTAGLVYPRLFHTATLLTNGTVLIVGGVPASDYALPPLPTNELFDPTGTGSFGLTGNLNTPRNYHAATLLPSGNVLIVGGVNYYLPSPGVLMSELYQPASLIPSGVTTITVTPVPSTMSVNSAVHFTAIGNNGQQLNAVTWSATPTGIVTITNDGTNSGTAYAVAPGTVIVSACVGSVCGSTSLTAQ
jgi:hypothetical protein